jgi:CubicO group peptidase (beta-lactamase class C family)
MRSVDDHDLNARVRRILNRRPVVGLAVGLVRGGRLEFFHGHGFADLRSRTPITEDTVFRTGSVTKTVTAVAVLQLAEQGLIDIDRPVGDYLRAYRLVPARAGHRPPTVRQLLTHTAGLPQLVYPWRAFAPVLGETVRFGRPVPSLAEFYRGGLHLVAEPATTHTYSNHGFATLGQIVEDLSGQPLDQYLRENIFAPLGMADTDLVRSERVRARLATGYTLRRHGPRPAGDRDLITIGAGGIYTSIRDLARYAAAMLSGGGNEHGSVLKPETVTAMFAPQYQPDPRLPGMGLAFFRRDAGGHLIVDHDGLLPGFASELALAVEDGVGVVAFTTGARDAKAWLGVEVSGLLRQVIGIPDDVIRTDVAQHPEVWRELCGWYAFRGSLRDVQRWFIAGADVVARGGRLTLRPVTPIPALSRRFVLHPDDDSDPYVFRINLSGFGLGTSRVVFGRGPAADTMSIHLDIAPMSFDRRSVASNPRVWGTGALGALAGASVAAAVHRHRMPKEGGAV